jgi:hypothetical protein
LHKKINFNALKKSNKKWISYFLNVIKKILLISSISVALLLIIAQFANLHILINPIEKIASETFLQRVKVQTIHASIIPQPHLILEGFTIGDSATVSAQKIRIYPNLLTLKEKINTITKAPYDISSIEIDGLNFSQSDMPEMNTWASNINTNKLLKIKEIILNKARAQLNGIGPLIINSDVFLNEKNQFNNAIITTEDKNLTVSVQGVADNYLIDIEGIRWRLPISPNPIFTQLKAKGSFKDNILTLSSIEGALYKGTVNANLTSNLAKNWDTQGNFKLNHIRLIDIAQDIKYDSVIEGKLDTSGNFSFNINKSSNQVDALKIKAKFKVNNGLIKKIDLVEAMRSGRANGATSFTKLSGNAYVNKRNYQFNNLLLRENQLHATGSLRISPTKKVTGVVSSQISVKQKSIKSRFKIAGSTDRINLVN